MKISCFLASVYVRSTLLFNSNSLNPFTNLVLFSLLAGLSMSQFKCLIYNASLRLLVSQLKGIIRKVSVVGQQETVNDDHGKLA